MDIKDIVKTDVKNIPIPKKGPVEIEVNDPVTAVAKFGVGVIHETFGFITDIVNSNNQRRVALAQIQAELDKALATIDAKLKVELKKIDDTTKLKMKALDVMDNSIQGMLNNSDFPADIKATILNDFIGKLTTMIMKA
ncbi:MAG: hypothetical protein SPL22_06030 [Treponema sp.]|uniref:hypothetical protein n=1 Tax=Treponema sp. TaxID=166 RepID=UPI002A91097E|nr:hypothetical protein [Treponema sp.]MDY6397272.1 hypothetical protein [Treponema sp.]